MNSEWKSTRLVDVAVIRNGAGVKQEHFASEGVSLARVTNFTDSSIDLKDSVKVGIEHAQKWEGHRLATGDALVATVGSWPPNWASVVGKAVLVPRTAHGAIQNQNTCCIRAQNGKAIQRFLYYVLKTEDFGHYAANSASGSANQARLPVFKLESFTFNLPSFEEQERIATTLGALDDRITLLRETNATLEAIAQAIFKSWFVDFDPVRAKQEGRTPEGMDEATAALFPDSFEESELGLVPKGWEIRKAETLLTRLSTKVRYTKEQISSSGATPVYEQGAGILLGYHDSPAQFSATPNEPMFVFGDHTCVTHLTCEPFDISMNVIPLKGSNRSTLWTYYAIKDKQSFQEYRRHWMELAIKEIVVASIEICEQFSLIASSLHVKMESNTWQANTLATLRDNLLPRLISGQLRLPEAQSPLADVFA